MKSRCFWFAGIIFLGIILSSSSAFSQVDTTIFECLTADSGLPASSVVRDTISPVAIYACGTYAYTDLLPGWAKRVFNPAVQLSVPSFYRNNSLGKYILNSRALGRDSTHCFTFTYPGANDTLDDDNAEQWFKQVMPYADTITGINFADFDADTNGEVDGLFFIVVNHNYDQGFRPRPGGPNDFNYKTRDVNAKGDTVIVDESSVIVMKTTGEERAVHLAAHEWGHTLGLPDLYGGGSAAPVNAASWWNLGSFSIMGDGFPGYRAVPLDPYNRIRLGWATPTTVTAPVYGQNIPDYLTTGTIYKLPKDSTEYFLVTNHKGVNPAIDTAGRWEERMPGIGGLMIWHINEAGAFDIQSNKRIDCELAHGLFNFKPQFVDTAGVNPASGRDSLDILFKKPLPNPCCFQWNGYKPPDIASARCYWNQNTQINFDGLSNPNSDGYSGSIDQGTGMRIQNVQTRLAVRNIQKTIQSSATADLLVNNWYGRISQNTTWGPNKVYAITEDVTVDYGVTLTASPGTIIKVDRGKKLIIKGTLSAAGGVGLSDSIIWTSSSTTPAAGDWGGVVIDSFGRANIEFSRFSFADTAIAVRGDTATVLVYNSTFTHFSKAAVSSRSAKTRLGGIVPVPNPPDCGRNNFLMNTADPLAKAVIKSSQPGGTLKAEGNWWTQAPPPSSWFSGNVDRTPYLLGYATPDSCNSSGAFSQPPPEERISVRPTVPISFELGQNYPNPFNPTATIEYALPEPVRVELRIFNTLGQVVRTLVDEHQGAGYHHAVWDGKDETGRTVSTGIYLYQIKAGDFVETKKMQFVK